MLLLLPGATYYFQSVVGREGGSSPRALIRGWAAVALGCLIVTIIIISNIGSIAGCGAKKGLLACLLGPMRRRRSVFQYIYMHVQLLYCLRTVDDRPRMNDDRLTGPTPTSMCVAAMSTGALELRHWNLASLTCLKSLYLQTTANPRRRQIGWCRCSGDDGNARKVFARKGTPSSSLPPASWTTLAPVHR